MVNDPVKMMAMLGKLSDSINKFVMIVPKMALTAAMGLPGRAAGIAGGVAAAPISKMGLPADLIAKIVSPIGDAFMGIVTKITGAMSPIISLVEMMNPALVQQFTFAINDLMAVFGDILQPILAAVTGVVRKLGDTFATMKPVIDPIIQIIVKYIEIMARLIDPIARIMVPVLQLWAAQMESVLIPIIEFTVGVLELLAKALVWLANEAVKSYNMIANSVVGRKLGLKGITPLSFDAMKRETAQGGAIRETNRTDADSLGAKTREMSFGQTQKNMLQAMNTTAVNTAILVQTMASMLGWTEEQVRQKAKELGFNLE